MPLERMYVQPLFIHDLTWCEKSYRRERRVYFISYRFRLMIPFLCYVSMVQHRLGTTCSGSTERDLCGSLDLYTLLEGGL